MICRHWDRLFSLQFDIKKKKLLREYLNIYWWNKGKVNNVLYLLNIEHYLIRKLFLKKPTTEPMKYKILYNPVALYRVSPKILTGPLFFAILRRCKLSTAKMFYLLMNVNGFLFSVNPLQRNLFDEAVDFCKKNFLWWQEK